MTLGEIKDLFDQVPESTIHDIVTGEEPLRVVDNQGTLGRSPPIAPPRSRARAAARRIGKLFDGVQKESERAESLYSLIDLGEDAQQPARMIIEEDRALVEPMGSDAGAVGSPGADVESDGFLVPPTAYAQEVSPSLPVEEELRRALHRLLHSVKNAPPARRGQAEHWARAKVAPGVYLTAEDLETDDVHMLEEVVRLLRRLILEADEDR
jgi:hypothetical protein